jgi:hypothetical protein
MDTISSKRHLIANVLASFALGFLSTRVPFLLMLAPEATFTGWVGCTHDGTIASSVCRSIDRFLWSTPIAALLCLLKPRRLVLYTAIAVLPLLVRDWSSIFPSEISLIWPSLIVYYTVEIIRLPLTVWMLARWIGPEPPDKSLEPDAGCASATQLKR